MKVPEAKASANPSVVRKTFGRHGPEILAWAALGLFLVVGLPLFLRMPLWVDISWYGICARDILHGGILERDVNVFCRPPMMAWVLVGIRWLVGWRIWVLRLVDFAVVSAIVFLLAQWWAPPKRSRAGQVATALLLYAFYFSTTEWCHAQPDVWMFLPAVGALFLRRRQTAELVRTEASLPGAGVRAFAEGLLWGMACLFKPYAALPGLICWLVSAAQVWAASPKWPRRLGMDALGMLGGGLIAGGAWLVWLCWGGGWSYFWEDVRVWGGGYFNQAPAYQDRLWYLVRQFPPWGWVHVVAVPLALAALGVCVVTAVKARRKVSPGVDAQALLGGFYLGWLVEANFLQWQYDYQLVPALLLGLLLLAGQSWLDVRPSEVDGRPALLVRTPAAWVILLGFLGAAAARHPVLDVDRLALWRRCWPAGGSIGLHDRLTLETREYPPRWADLGRVANYLRSQGVRDGELTCHGLHTIHLYLDLDVAPSTRLPLLSAAGMMYPDHQELINQELKSSRQRFVVTDLKEVDYYVSPITVAEPGAPLALPLDFPKELKVAFPWSEPIVFRAGSFLVHQVRNRTGASPGSSPD